MLKISVLKWPPSNLIQAIAFMHYTVKNSNTPTFLFQWS